MMGALMTTVLTVPIRVRRLIEREREREREGWR